MSSLHVESIGSGAPLLLIHGWGMHGGVWEEVAQKLAADLRVHSVDLLGYGKSARIDLPPQEKMAIVPSPSPTIPRRERGMDSLNEIVELLATQFSEPLTVCGWSLGGQIALHWAAREPDKVRRLILVASTPCFAQRADWTCGMESDVLRQFAGDLEQNHAATLRRFIALQLRGSENERELQVRLRERLFSRGEPDMAALRAGLDILRDVDLRGELQDIKQPAMIIAGERDKLTPPAASRYMARTMPSAQLMEVEGAAHAPFLSHPEIFIEQIKSFLHE
ncbi:pimeloyl-[acyl-carrier protein] methyl ester esterase [mine drainage metagenome]|uniref:Pimeloyl-[acyl-carrier protein] methyl ester esterase n=1 Tax=mine drainage metagenome TaxID=410659 RepID=A0A1J5TDP9_9ZZZZ